MADDPNFFHLSQNQTCYPPRPLSVTGFEFDPAAGTLDFSAVPGFSLGRLLFVRHEKTDTFLYSRPESDPYGLAAVDGAAVPPPPTVGKVLKVKPSTAGMLATDEIMAAYELQERGPS